MGVIKHLALRIDEDLLKKFRFVCKYDGRSANSELLVMIRKIVDQFEKQHGEIESE